MSEQPEALRLADVLEKHRLTRWVHSTGKTPRASGYVVDKDCAQAAVELRRLHEETRKLKTVMVAAAEEISKHWEAHCDSEGYGPANLMHRLEEGIASEYGYTAGAFARLEAENARLRAWQQSAWQRGHAVGLNGLNEALRQMEAHKKSDAWGNTQLTEALLRAEEQRDEIFTALVEISLLTHLGGEVAEYGDVVDAVRRLKEEKAGLLEALRTAVDHLEGMPDQEDVAACVVKARAAIAKATGEQT